MSHVSKVLRSTSGSMFLVLGNEKGLPCYHYIQVNPLKRYLFSQVRQGEKIDLALFGDIIESGYGEPTEAVRIRMLQLYGFEPDDA